MQTTHLICRAKRPGWFVFSDDCRRDWRATLARRISTPILADVVMDSHFHAQVLGPPEPAVKEAEAALHEFVYRRSRRHPETSWWEREPVSFYTANDAEALAVSLKYIHDNPLKAKMAKVSWHHPWGSAREFAGLSRVGHIDVRLAWALLGSYVHAIGVPGIELVGLEKSAAPSASLETLLAAAAAFYGVSPEEMVGPRPRPAAQLARALYIQLVQLERFSLPEAASLVQLTRGRLWQVSKIAIPEEDVRGARTLIQVPALRIRLARRRAA